jgi:hypothetical protein
MAAVLTPTFCINLHASAVQNGTRRKYLKNSVLAGTARLADGLGSVGITRPMDVSEGIAVAKSPGAEGTAAKSVTAVPGFSWPVGQLAPATT